MKLGPIFLMHEGQICSDPEGVQFEAAGLWVARFSEEWRAQYGTTWGLGFAGWRWFHYGPTAAERAKQDLQRAVANHCSGSDAATFIARSLMFGLIAAYIVFHIWGYP
jgi:hypothetical protein